MKKNTQTQKSLPSSVSDRKSSIARESCVNLYIFTILSLNTSAQQIALIESMFLNNN